MKAALALLLLLAAFDRKAWEDSPEAQFMTTEERREWKVVRNDVDAQRFIEAFRARHSADFPQEAAKRAAVVDERLKMGEMKASKQLRGRIVMLLGAPAEISTRHIPKPYRGSIGVMTPGRTGAVTKSRPAGKKMGSDGWMEYTFRFAPRPELGIGEEGWTVVIETDVISGKDSLKHARDKKKMEEILDAAARVTLRSEK